MMIDNYINIYFCGLNADNSYGGIQRYEVFFKKIISENSNPRFVICNTSKFFSRWPYIRQISAFFPLFIRKNPSIFFSVNYKLPIYIFPKITRFITVHDLCYIKVPETMPLRRKLLSTILMPFSLKKADVIIVPSICTKNDILDLYPQYEEKIRTVPLAGNFDNIKNSNKNLCKSKNYFLFVGTIEPRKNLSRLLQAYAKLSDELKYQHNLIVVGKEGWGSVNLAEKIHSLKLNKYVKHIATASDDDLFWIYQDAYCLILPSLYEGFGLPIIEAQRHGVPVITSNISAMPEVIGEGGLLIDPYSVDSITKKLEKIILDKNLKKELSIKAKENSQKYSWENTKKLIIDIFMENSINSLDNNRR